MQSLFISLERENLPSIFFSGNPSILVLSYLRNILKRILEIFMYVCSQHHWQIIITLTTCIADKNTREQHLQFFIVLLLSKVKAKSEAASNLSHLTAATQLKIKSFAKRILWQCKFYQNATHLWLSVVSRGRRQVCAECTLFPLPSFE